MRRLLLLTVVGVLECEPYGPGVTHSTAGAVFGATAIGATALQRSATSGCWANCQTGTQCDKESGMCVPIPCGGCPADAICVDSPRGEECVHRARETRVDSIIDAGDAGADARESGADAFQN
jgi:hypothetical protein